VTAQNSNILRVPDKFTQVWQSKKPYQIWYGGRGSAKSWTKAIYFLTKSMGGEYNRTVFARDTQKNVRNSQYQLFKDICNRFDCFRDKFDFKDTVMKVTCKKNDNFLVGGSFEQPDTLRSVADPTDFWAEEPITREAQIKRQDFFDIVGSLRNSYGIPTQFHFTFNPISKLTWIYQDFFESELYKGDVETLFVNYWDNPFCPESTVNFLKSLKMLDPKRYEVDGLGNWGVAYEGLIYQDWTPADEMPDVQFYGLDFGYNDPTALTAGAVQDVPDQPKKDYFVKELLYKTHLTSSLLIKELQRLEISKVKTIMADNARPEMIEDLKKAGYNVKPCTKYKGSVVEGINAVKNYHLRPVKGSKNLFDELSTYVWKEKDEVLLDEPEEGMDHLCDAFRYGIETQNIQPWTQSTRSIR
jgi:phage terminase large subunit